MRATISGGVPIMRPTAACTSSPLEGSISIPARSSSDSMTGSWTTASKARRSALTRSAGTPGGAKMVRPVAFCSAMNSKMRLPSSVVASSMKVGVCGISGERVSTLWARMESGLEKLSVAVTRWAGSSWGFAVAVISLLGWAVAGPFTHYSQNWQLVVNTATTIVTFLMVFLIQNTQNRDAKAVHLKLDEIIRAIKGARNELVDLEELSDDDLKKLEEQFQRLRKKAEHNVTQSRKVQSATSR